MDTPNQMLVNQAQKIADSSNLPDDDKKLLTENIPFLPDEALEAFVQLCQDSPAAIENLVKNMRIKMGAADDPKQIQQILDQERKEIEEVKE